MLRWLKLIGATTLWLLSLTGAISAFLLEGRDTVQWFIAALVGLVLLYVAEISNKLDRFAVIEPEYEDDDG